MGGDGTRHTPPIDMDTLLQSQVSKKVFFFFFFKGIDYSRSPLKRQSTGFFNKDHQIPGNAHDGANCYPPG